MFSIGQKIVYKGNGLCIFRGTEEKKIAGHPVSYYLLTPCTRPNSSVLVPCANPALVEQMRPMLTREEAAALLAAPAPAEEWTESERERSAQFRAVLSEYDRPGLVRMIRILHHHKAVITAKGRRLYASDEKLYKEATELLCAELSEALSLPPEITVKRILSAETGEN